METVTILNITEEYIKAKGDFSPPKRKGWVSEKSFYFYEY